MIIKEIIEQLDLVVAAGYGGVERIINGVYISDLLSNVIINAQVGFLWLTVQSHQNIIAVAVLKELAAIILVNGYQLSSNTKYRANLENIPVLLTHEGIFKLVGKLHCIGL